MHWEAWVQADILSHLSLLPMSVYNSVMRGVWHFTAFTNVIYCCDFSNFGASEKQSKIAKKILSGGKEDQKHQISKQLTLLITFYSTSISSGGLC
jgi:hypothetical protein